MSGGITDMNVSLRLPNAMIPVKNGLVFSDSGLIYYIIYISLSILLHEAES